MKVVRYGKSKLAFGVLWTTLPGAASQINEIRTLAKDNQAKYYVTIAREGSLPLVGLIPKPDTRGQCKAAASMILQLCPDIENAVFAFQFPDGSAAAICFRDGLPMVGYDFCGSVATVSQRIAQFVNSLGDLSGTVLCAGEPRLFSDSPYLAEIQQFNFEEEKLEGKEFKAAIFQPAFPPTVALVFLAVLLIGSMGGWYAYDQYQKEELRKQQSKKIDPNVAYEASVTKALAEAGPLAPDTARVLYPFISALPLYFGGWNLDVAVCQIDSCSLTWMPEIYLASTFDDFKASLPETWSAAYRSDFQTVVSSMPTEASKSVGVKREMLPGSNDFLVSMGSQVQRLKFIGVDLRIDPATLFAVPPLPPDNPPITESVLKNPVKEGSWRLTGGWVGMDFLWSLPPSMTITSITMNARNYELAIQVEGKYYVAR